MELEQDPNLRFFEILREESDDKRDPIPEWELKGYVGSGVDHCICGTAIILNYLIVHKRTQKQLIIGSECMMRWMKPKLVCKECESPLGRVAERMRKQDFHCRSCKLMLKRQEAYEQLRKEAKIKKFGQYLLYYQGKYSMKTFKEIIEDQDFVLHLLTLPDSKVTKSIQAFREYASFFYDVIDVEV